MRAVLVGVDFGKGDFLASLEELALLSKSAGAEPAAAVTGRRASPDPALYVGSGKAEEIRETLSDLDRSKLERIIEMLNEQVRPFLQGDGGDLHVIGLEGKTLKVHYQGACGSCPSSLTATLSGIEGLVRTVDPELEVIPV